MDLARILENEDWVVDYDKGRGMYRVSKFEDYHFKDEIWFDAYEDKKINEDIHKIAKDLKHYLYTNEDHGVVYMPVFFIENFLKKYSV